MSAIELLVAVLVTSAVIVAPLWLIARIVLLVRDWRKRPYPTIAEQIEASKQRLAMLDAIHTAVENRDQVMAIIGNAADVGASRRAIQELLGLDELGANCVLDMQLRRFSEAERVKIDLSRQELRDWLANPVVEDHQPSRRLFRRRGWIRVEP